MPDRFNKPVGHMTKGPEDQGPQDSELPARTHETVVGAPVTAKPADRRNSSHSYKLPNRIRCL